MISPCDCCHSCIGISYGNIEAIKCMIKYWAKIDIQDEVND